jgi:hypothetical protein
MTMTVFPQHTTPSRHRCYGPVARRHLTMAGLTALPVAVAAKAVAAVASQRPVNALVTTDRTDLILLALCVLVPLLGIPAWGLIEHLVAHCLSRTADTSTDQWLIDEHGRWWYRPGAHPAEPSQQANTAPVERKPSGAALSDRWA